MEETLTHMDPGSLGSTERGRDPVNGNSGWSVGVREMKVPG